MGCTAITAPMMIRMSDHWHLGYCIGIAFLIRAIVFIIGFPILEIPDGVMTYIICSIMLCCTAVQSIAVESYFSKLVPSDIAGSMRGLYNFFGQIGVLLMSILAGYLYDVWGPSSPFLIIGILDFILATLTIVLCLLGKVKTNNT